MFYILQIIYIYTMWLMILFVFTLES